MLLQLYFPQQRRLKTLPWRNGTIKTMFFQSYWKQSQLLAGLTSKREKMQSEYSCLCSNKITANKITIHPPFFTWNILHIHLYVSFEKFICLRNILPYLVFSLILSMTGKINFQTGKAILLPVEFSRIPSNF